MCLLHLECKHFFNFEITLCSFKFQKKSGQQTSFGLAVVLSVATHMFGFLTAVDIILASCCCSDFDDCEFDTIASQCFHLDLERLGVRLLGQQWYDEIRSSEERRPDFKQRNLCRRVLRAWYDGLSYEPCETRRCLIRVMCQLGEVELAKAIAKKEYE